jgi:heme-degrading monooxygenase HmoA
MMLRVSGDAKELEAFAAANSAAFQATAERAKQHGVTRHRFYGNDSEVIVVDEWPDEESFDAFFQASPEIAGYVEAAGVTSEPVITFWGSGSVLRSRSVQLTHYPFWRPLDTNDDIG